MKNNRKRIWVFSVSGLVSLIFTGSVVLNVVLYLRNDRTVFEWSYELETQTSIRAAREAESDFRSGELRLFSIDPTAGDRQYTGTNEGPFEVWRPDFDPEYHNMAAPRFALKVYVEYYNRKMRYMHDHPERFLPDEKVSPSETEE